MQESPLPFAAFIGIDWADKKHVLAAFQTRGNLALRIGFQARFSALEARFLVRAAALDAERSLASLSR
jgi:hypothetical protein